MRLLTGTTSDTFDFIPDSITSFGSTVLSEGCDSIRSISWVHAWTVSNGIITQVREYFNTSLTVTRIGDSSSNKSSTPSEFQASSSASGIKSAFRKCPPVWESSLSNRVGKSVPGLVLAL